MHRTQILVATLFCSWVAVSPLEAQGQPLSPVRESGQSVSPAFEGWYRNPDGTISLSFGYFNRNATEVVELPIGPNNFFTPGPADRGQPTSFQPRRHWGVFAVTVPANWPPRDKVVWTLVIKGDTLRVRDISGPTGSSTRCRARRAAAIRPRAQVFGRRENGCWARRRNGRRATRRQSWRGSRSAGLGHR